MGALESVAARDIRGGGASTIDVRLDHALQTLTTRLRVAAAFYTNSNERHFTSIFFLRLIRCGRSYSYSECVFGELPSNCVSMDLNVQCHPSRSESRENMIKEYITLQTCITRKYCRLLIDY